MKRDTDGVVLLLAFFSRHGDVELMFLIKISLPLLLLLNELQLLLGCAAAAY